MSGNSGGGLSGTCGGGRLLLARAASSQAALQLLNSNLHDEDSNQLSVDTDFDSYWEEEARNPHRNRIRIGRQYQATVPAVVENAAQPIELLDKYHLERPAANLETLSFCPTRAAQLTDAELHHYFTVAKSLNLFAELVQTRSLLGRDVTIADLNRIRNKEGLSLASVIQPPARQLLPPTTTSSPPQETPQVSASSPAPAVPSQTTANTSSPVNSPREQTTSNTCFDSSSAQPVNQALMKALSHFISLHHPCHHDDNCKKLDSKDLTQDTELSTVSDNLRQQIGKSSSSRSRSALKQHSSSLSNSSSSVAAKDETDPDDSSSNSKYATQQEWSREEIELFSKAIEVCGKNFGSIKKEFLPTKSVRSIVEYYYIGSRSDSPGEGSLKTRKASQNTLETTTPTTETTSCSPDKSSNTNNNNNSHGDGSSGSSSGNANRNGQSSFGQHANLPSNTDNTASSGGHINPSQISNSSPSETTSSNKQSANINDDTFSSGSSNNNNKSTPNSLRKPQISTGCSGNKTIDARMSVYNFDDEFKEESPKNLTAVQFDPASQKSGIGVKPLKAKPIMPNALIDSDSANSNLGSLKFFMDGQLILKLNACQDQQEGQEKCHWVQSGERLMNANSKKKLTKKPDKLSDGQPTNGSQSNSVVSSFQDDDSKTDFVNDEDSKESLNSSFSQSSNQQHLLKNQHHQASSPSSNKRLKATKNPASDPATSGIAAYGHQQQLPPLINYNRLGVDSSARIKDANNIIHSPLDANPAINHQAAAAAAAAAAMPWLQANSFAMAAALLGQLPFPPNPATNIVEPNPTTMPPTFKGNTDPPANFMTSKPMDLSLEHTTTTSTPNKTIQLTNNNKIPSRSKSSKSKHA